MNLLIRNGRIIDPGQGIDKWGSLLIAGDRISGFYDDASPPAGYDILDAEGLVICPGFIDLHCHLREPGFEAKETIATGTRAAAGGGFTTVCCMPNTQPPLDKPSTIARVKAIAERDGVVRVLPIGCVTRGRRGGELADLDALASAGAIAFSDDGQAVADSVVMRQALEWSASCGLAIMDHCEDASLAQGGQMNEGIMSKQLGLKGIPAEAEEIIVARDIALAKLTGGRLHIAHVSTAGTIELLERAKADGVKVTAEATPHHLTLTEEALNGGNTDAKVSPPLRTARDVAALVQALDRGTLDIVATDHAPHTEADKKCPFEQAAFGISGLETAFGSLMGLVHAGKIRLNTLISRLTCDPARVLGASAGLTGTLAHGGPADITIVDPGPEWRVDVSRFASKGRNTPLAGMLLKGKVVATVSRGKLVYCEESVRTSTPTGVVRR